MKMSVREARAQFAHALSAAERGERVTITRNGKAVAELAPPSAPQTKRKLDWDKLDEIQAELGIQKPNFPLDEAWREAFDDPASWPDLFGPEYR